MEAKPVTGSDWSTGMNPGTSSSADPHRMKDEAQQVAKDVGQSVSSAASKAWNHAADAAQHARHGASDVAEKTQRKAAEYARMAQSHGRDALDHQRQTAADQLHTFSDAAHRAAERFREEKDDNIAGYIDAGADEIERLSNYLREKDLNSLWRDTQQFARRRPEWFLGGMFVAGLAITRFLKASSSRQHQHDRELTGYGDRGTYSYEQSQPQASAMGIDATPRLPDLPGSSTAYASVPTQPAASPTPYASSDAGSTGATFNTTPEVH